VASLVDAALAAGAEAFARRDFAAAERAFRDALAAAPEDRSAAFNLAKVCEVLGRRGEALTLYSRLVRRDRTDRESWVRIGVVSYGIGSYAAACDAFTAALQLRSDAPTPRSTSACAPPWPGAPAMRSVCWSRP
jgi:tetratricopeptide (TPR) repeat protein